MDPTKPLIAALLLTILLPLAPSAAAWHDCDPYYVHHKDPDYPYNGACVSPSPGIECHVIISDGPVIDLTEIHLWRCQDMPLQLYDHVRDNLGCFEEDHLVDGPPHVPYQHVHARARCDGSPWCGASVDILRDPDYLIVVGGGYLDCPETLTYVAQRLVGGGLRG